ncbi:MAG TPA: site-specific integrase [Gemmatimonadales bacterium]|nr:site-specific integrase [Gemmatimonadales bacterium]
MTPRAVRGQIYQLGVKRQRLVTVVQEGPRAFRVDRYVDGRRRKKRFTDRAAAIQWADAWYRAAERLSANLTLRELFDRYLVTMAQLKGWRGTTILNYRAHRKRIEEALGPDTRVNELTLASLDTLWTNLAAIGMAPNQIRAKVKLLQRMMAWGYARELTSHNKLAQWSEMPEVTPRRVAEYSPAEVEALLRQFDPLDAWEWRPWALIMIAQSQGFRINALLRLRWEDVDLETGGPIQLRSAYDKTKRDWDRPMSWDAFAALLTARYHRQRLGKTSPWVFYGKEEAPYTYGAFHHALLGAEECAEIPHAPFRAAHGFRRHAVNVARQRTGDAALAMLWVGDTDLRQAKSYVRPREAELQSLADQREDA